MNGAAGAKGESKMDQGKNVKRENKGLRRK